MFSNPADLSATLTQAQRIAPLLMSLALCLAGLLSVAAVWQFRLSRVDKYWRFRRAAGQRGARLATFAALCVVLAGGTCAADSVSGMFLATWHETPTPGPGVVIVVVPNATPTDPVQHVPCTVTPTVTFAAESSPTVTPTPTTSRAVLSATPLCQVQY